MPNNIPRTPTFCSFALLITASLTHFIHNPDSSRELTIYMISLIFSLEIINVVLSDPNILLWIAASVADAASINDNGIKKLLTNGLSTFPIKGNPVFSNGPKGLPKKLPDYSSILCNWVFESFILADEVFRKSWQIFETYVSVNNNLCGKLF